MNSHNVIQFVCWLLFQCDERRKHREWNWMYRYCALHRHTYSVAKTKTENHEKRTENENDPQTLLDVWAERAYAYLMYNWFVILQQHTISNIKSATSSRQQLRKLQFANESFLAETTRDVEATTLSSETGKILHVFLYFIPSSPSNVFFILPFLFVVIRQINKYVCFGENRKSSLPYSFLHVFLSIECGNCEQRQKQTTKSNSKHSHFEYNIKTTQKEKTESSWRRRSRKQ